MKEVLEYVLFCLCKCKLFYGREEFLGIICYGLINSKGERVVVIYGELGCGKIFILVKIVKDVKYWLEN